MMRVNRLGMIVVLAVGAMAAPAFAANVTVGQFLTRLAEAKHLVAADAASAEANLRSAGFNLPRLELGKPLTEGDMTAISNALGVAVTTERPSSLITDTQMATFMTSFRGQIGVTTPRVGDPAPNAIFAHQHQGKKHKQKKHKNKSPKEPI